MSAHGFRSISFPSRGAFHLSLTVLVHYRSSRVFSLALWSGRIPTGFLVSRGTQEQIEEPFPFIYRTVTCCGGPFQDPSTRVWLVTPLLNLDSALPVLQPPISIGSRTTKLIGFRLFPFRSPLLRESYLFLGVLRCFTSPTCLHLAYVFG